MWVVVYIAPNRKIADYVKEMLEIEGIMVKLKESNSLEQENRNVEVMVSEVEIEEATEVINNALQNS
ncbi:MAG TPA: glutamate decarboxylase [Bacillota bacterium]|jgi:hypothetical protein|nr:glutamate decarboxylase [Bacillota bacterium]HOL10382.1 glutamate decarboxylase [Bacillota bacterium]HPO97435.1 glutamate decarboxylase [Bacillota bacterium]